MKTFETFKEYFAAKSKEQSACSGEYKKLLASENWEQILTVMKNNANWCYIYKVIDADILEQYIPDEILLENGIYVKKNNIVQKEGLAVYYSSTSKHYDSSTSEHYDSSTSKHYGSSTSKHYGSSTSKHYDSSTSEHYDSSTSKHYDSSTSEHYDSSTSKHYDSSTSEHYDSSTSKHYDSSTSKHYDSSTHGSVNVLKDTSIIHDSAIVRERSTGKVYFKKSAFEIVEI